MLPSEKKSLYRFIAIYVISTMLLFVGGAVIFYHYERSRTILEQKAHLKQEALMMIPAIQSRDIQKINRFTETKVAAYSGKKDYVFGNFVPEAIRWEKTFSVSGKRLRYILLTPPPDRQHIAYVIVEKTMDDRMMPHLKRTIAATVLLAWLIVLLLAYVLGRLFLAPMREALHKINLFVQDTTHELNTPISTILTNIEMITLLKKCPKSEEMERIRIAAGTLSRIYDDLSYLRLNETTQRQIEEIDLSAFLEERLTYFASFMRAKQIVLTKDIRRGVVRRMDRTDAMRLFDNLLSNAIKYNHIGGSITVRLDAETFVVEDSGRGMDQKTQRRAFERFTRGDESEGGFGIGLDIVSAIVKQYHYRIEIDSKLGEGSTIKLYFFQS